MTTDEQVEAAAGPIFCHAQFIGDAATARRLARDVLTAALARPAEGDGALRTALRKAIAHMEDGDRHDEDAFDESCDTCILLAELRAMLAAAPIRSDIKQPEETSRPTGDIHDD